MQFFKNRTKTPSSGNQNTDNSAAKSSNSRNGRQSLLAAAISLLITACLLTACGFFVVSGLRRRTADNPRQAGSSASDPSTWLGLEPVTRILSPDSEAPVAYTFSDGTDQDPSQNSASGPARTTSPNPAEADKDGTGPAAGSSSYAAVPAAPSGDASTAASADPAKALSKDKSAKSSKDSTAENAAKADSTAENAAKAGKDKEAAKADKNKTAEKDGGDTAKSKDLKDASEKAASEKQKESEKESEKEKDKKEKEKEEEKDKEKDKEDDKEKDKDKDKDKEDSLTKTQKKYVRTWEENHLRTFPLSTGLHDYNWKYLKYDDDGRLHYTGDDDYTVRRGIDVSEFQGQIDWEKVKKAGYDFVFVRAGHRTFHTGSLERDTRAIKNLTRAQKAGLDVGVYVFSQAVTIEEAIEEAELCLDVIEESKVKITLPIVFDPEIQIEYDARINYISNDQFTNNAVAFCETIKDAGYTPGIYANCSTETDILNMSRLENAEIWYADYNSVPESPYRFTYWQYTNTGWVDGIPEAETDLNFWFVKKEQSD